MSKRTDRLANEYYAACSDAAVQFLKALQDETAWTKFFDDLEKLVQLRVVVVAAAKRMLKGCLSRTQS